LTDFVTTWVIFEFIVISIEAKNEPAMFQRIVMWVFRGQPHACVYIDDVLIATGPMAQETIVETHLKLVQNFWCLQDIKPNANGQRYIYS
jgi:hypothetical protein